MKRLGAIRFRNRVTHSSPFLFLMWWWCVCDPSFPLWSVVSFWLEIKSLWPLRLLPSFLSFSLLLLLHFLILFVLKSTLYCLPSFLLSKCYLIFYRLFYPFQHNFHNVYNYLLITNHFLTKLNYNYHSYKINSPFIIYRFIL